CPGDRGRIPAAGDVTRACVPDDTLRPRAGTIGAEAPGDHLGAELGATALATLVGGWWHCRCVLDSGSSRGPCVIGRIPALGLWRVGAGLAGEVRYVVLAFAPGLRRHSRRVRVGVFARDGRDSCLSSGHGGALVRVPSDS